MASKEATPATVDDKKKEKEEKQFFAFEFALPVDKIGATTTNPQVKSKTNDAFLGYGSLDECRVTGAVGQDRTVTVFFARLFAKGQAPWDALQGKNKVTIKVYDEDFDLKLSDATPSGGGATSGTSSRPKKESKKPAGRGRGRGDRKPDGEGAPKAEGGAAAPAADGKKEDGKKEGGRGRGRGKKEEEKKGPSLQRGRANIGGKLGPVSKVRLARQAKEARDKENAARIARGEKPLEDAKSKKDDDDEPKLPEKKGAGGKKDGKKDAGKAGKADGKKDAGKADAGKAAAKKGK